MKISISSVVLASLILPDVAVSATRMIRKGNTKHENHQSSFVAVKKDSPTKTRGRSLQQTPCLEDGWEMWSSGGCTLQGLEAALSSALESVSCGHGARHELHIHLDVNTDEQVEEILLEACETAVSNSFVDFHELMMNGDPVATKAFFDGGTSFAFGSSSNVRSSLTGRAIHEAHSTVATSQGMTWPFTEDSESPVVNFEECEARAAMCCWVHDDSAMDNTDVCMVDMGRSPTSARVEGGFALFPGNAEGSSHCHGFAWSTDPTDPQSLFKGNNLFHVSMYEHLIQRGYEKPVPGAPMCACLEQMPVVDHAACTQVDISELWVAFSFNSGNGGLEAAISRELDIQFNPCEGVNNNGNSLLAHYRKLVQDGKASQEGLNILMETVVGNGNCDGAVQSFIQSMGMAG